MGILVLLCLHSGCQVKGGVVNRFRLEDPVPKKVQHVALASHVPRLSKCAQGGEPAAATCKLASIPVNQIYGTNS